jgi:hypothetical protein
MNKEETRMRKALVGLLLLGTAACGGQSNERSTQTTQEDLKTYDSAETTADVQMSMPPPPAAPAPMGRTSGPGIAPTAAPGVAFNYRYAFRLPAARISTVQEQHAQACEKAGPDRCRITGMRYRLVNDRDIEAMLAFKLDPALAREFGKQGIDAVTQAEGMLVDSEISGVDVGTQIQAAGRSMAEMEEELREVEARLARTGLRSSERAELQAQAARIRESIRAVRAGREQNRESLAKTPMVFHYGSGDLAPGFDRRPTLGEALQDAGDSFVGALLWIFVAAITLLPWLLIGALLLWIGLRVRRWVLRATPREATATPLPQEE